MFGRTVFMSAVFLYLKPLVGSVTVSMIFR